MIKTWRSLSYINLPRSIFNFSWVGSPSERLRSQSACAPMNLLDPQSPVAAADAAILIDLRRHHADD
jgi:hypothetical protein